MGERVDQLAGGGSAAGLASAGMARGRAGAPDDGGRSFADRVRDAERAEAVRRAIAAEEAAAAARGRIGAVEAERDRQARELGELARLWVGTEDRATAMADELRQLRKVESNLRAGVADLEGRLRRAGAAGADLSARLAAAEAAIAELHASTSWRLTTPVRAISQLLRPRRPDGARILPVEKGRP